MPEALKHVYNEKFIASLSKSIKKAYPAFDSKKFQKSVFANDWDEKELKERMHHITESLGAPLPADYPKALKILKLAAPDFGSFEAMFFPDFVETYGMDDFEESIEALEHFTKYSSSEFAVRPFIEKYPKKMMMQMGRWAKSKNEHVRRLASEGCRPRLPWAMALPVFKKDPAAVLKVLEKLKADASLYVRRSVANNLNDIAKDHPDVVAAIAASWLGISKETDWLVRHACRTLLKQGHPRVLTLFGFAEPKHVRVQSLRVQRSAAMGERMEFSFDLQTKEKNLGRLRVEYAIDFMKSNGKQARKIFQISEADCSGPKKTVEKYFSFKAISTRKYYVGKHGLAIIVNGHELASSSFELRDK